MIIGGQRSGGRAAPANLGNLGNLGTGVSDFSCQSWPTTPKFPAQTCLKTTTTSSSSIANNRKNCSTVFMIMSGVDWGVNIISKNIVTLVEIFLIWIISFILRFAEKFFVGFKRCYLLLHSDLFYFDDLEIFVLIFVTLGNAASQKQPGWRKTVWVSDFLWISIYIQGDPFEGKVCLCWEIPGDLAMSVPTLQQEKK